MIIEAGLLLLLAGMLVLRIMANRLHHQHCQRMKRAADIKAQGARSLSLSPPPQNLPACPLS